MKIRMTPTIIGQQAVKRVRQDVCPLLTNRLISGFVAPLTKFKWALFIGAAADQEIANE